MSPRTSLGVNLVAVLLLPACGVTVLLPDNDDGGTNTLDAGSIDSGTNVTAFDAGTTDSGVVDNGVFDGGSTDAGQRPNFALYRSNRLIQSSASGFTPAAEKVDVLFVVDSSGSMADKQTALAAAAGTFLTYARGTDYQLAVTTTDRDGMLRGNTTPAILYPSSPNQTATWSSRVQVGVNGSGIEYQLESALAAIRLPGVSLPSNAGFVRPNATLHLVIVTDAMDPSGLNPMATHDEALRAVYPHFRIHVIGPTLPVPPNSCPYDGSDSATNSRALQDYARSTNGIVAEICETSLVDTMTRVGRSVFGTNTRFPLPTTPPNIGLIQVSIGGAIVPALTNGGAVNWWYDSAANVVELAERVWPNDLVDIDIRY